MGERQPPRERERQADLAGVEVAGEHEVECARRDPLDGRREVAEEKSKTGVSVDERRRARATRRGSASGSTPTTETRSPWRSTVASSSRSSRACSRSPQLGGPRERIARHGDVVVSEHTNGSSSRASSSRRRGSPRGCETRSPVTQTRSGRRSATQSTARALAPLPRESGAPRWKSDRCPIRSPSSAAGSPSIGPRARACGASRPRTSRRRHRRARARRDDDDREHSEPEVIGATQDPLRGTGADRRAAGTAQASASAGLLESTLQRELLEHRLHRDDVPLEAELGVRQARGDADQLGEVQDRHLEVLARLLLELRLPRVE